MNKDEILEKSKKENQSADPYEMEINAKALTNGLWSAFGCTVVLTFIKFLKENVLDFGLLAMIWVLNAVAYTYKAVKLKEKTIVIQAVLYCIVAVIWTVLTIFQIFQG
ncbi:MAG: DUF6442 family protein [Ruminococcus sp.]|nr:DUF6442 family protein [Ruminococcus sp.]MCM1478844.1 DUF6442 family protein [Muribaculaceae bacterium]